MQNITIETEQDIVELKKRATAVSTKANFKITSQETLKQANEVMKTLKVAKKFIADKKASILQPLLLATKNTRELFRPMEEKIQSAEYSLKSGVLAYKKTVDDAIAKQKEKIEEKVETGKTTFEKASEQIEKVETKTDQFKTRKIQKLVITDKIKVPLAYWKIDEVLLKKALLEGKEIEGAKLEVEEIAVM